MDSLSALARMARTSSVQWGLIRSDQALSDGVSYSQLSRLTARGVLTRVRKGVYLMPGVERHRLEAVRAQWLNIGPQACAIAGTAILIHGYTTELQGRMRFASPKRFQGDTSDAIVRKQKLQPEAWELVDGLPTQRLEYAIVECWSLSNALLLTWIADSAGLEYWDFVNIPTAATHPLRRHILLRQMRPYYRRLYVSRAKRIYPAAFECGCPTAARDPFRLG